MISHPHSLGPELPYLEAFRAVCGEGGFTAAARTLGCTQPAVSYQIRKLEEILGVSLLERDGRRLVLTPEGTHFRTFVDKLFTELAQARSECLAGHRLEPLRLGSVSGFGRYVLMPALAALRDDGTADEGLEVRLEYEAADVLLERLEAGEYEATFVYKRKVSNALSYRVAYDEELVLVAPPSRRARPLLPDRGQIAAFEDVPFVTYEECEYVFGRWFDATFDAQPSRLISASHFTELEEVLDFVALGVGVSVVPGDSARARAAAGDVEILYAGSRKPCFNQVLLATRAGREPRPPVQRLLGLVGRRATPEAAGSSG